jgi:branched-chain amino acid aminotransferase group I
MPEIVYINGSLVPHSEAGISVFDHGFLYGYGLFETMRAYEGNIFLLDRHIARLKKSAENIGINLTGIDLEKACRDTLAANGLRSARVRLTVSHGDSDKSPWLEAENRPTVVITARDYRPYSPQVYGRGFRAGISSYRRSRYSSLSGIKSTNYLINVIARREATLDGLDESILLNEDGYITEGSTSNVFFIESSGLVTPPLESGILPGITRALVMEIAGTLGISVAEDNISPADLHCFSEAFLTSSMMEIMPLVGVKERNGEVITIGSGKPGEITRRLMQGYRSYTQSV